MNVKTRPDFKPCVHGAFDGGPTRAAYFDGMVLGAADMQREQTYWRTKRRLTNRALGQGVVWGLTVHWDARQRCFTLGPGYGLSCCGDDLVVECPQGVAEAELIDPCGEDFRRLVAATTKARLDPCNCDPKPDGPIDACLLLEYVECPEQPRSVYEDPCAESPDGCRYAAMRETTRLRLVPPPPAPPPGALAEFCRQIDKIRAELEAKLPGALMPPLVALQPDRAMVSLAAVDAAGLVLATDEQTLELSAAATATLSLTVPATATGLRLGLEPPPGQVFAKVKAGGAERDGDDVLMGVFETFPQVPAGASTLQVEAELVPLIGTAGGRRVTISLALAASPTAGPRPLVATVGTSEPLPARGDCSARLLQGLAGAAACNLRVLALALITGWFKGSLLHAGCARPDFKDLKDLKDDETLQARLLVAWLVCRVAWRAMYGIDIVAAQGAGLERCLQRLFAAWCEGLHYKGPRCDHHAHGIVLGCLQLSLKGRVLCFDEWQHRRHVLTGPLLTHWAGQFGLPPLDGAMARLARWICCVAQAPLAELPDGVPLPDFSVMAMASGALAAGAAPVAGAQVHGATVSEVRSIGAMDFVGRTLEMLLGGRRDTLAGASALRVLSAPGGGLHLLQPLQSALQPMPAPAAKAEALMAELDLAANTLPKMARVPLRDYVAAYAEKVTLAQMKPRAEAALFEPMVESLDAAGVVTLADLVTLGPEPALRRVRDVRPEDPVLADPRAAEKAIALVHEAAVKTLSGAGQAIVEAAKASDALEPFTRADLLEPGTISALRKAGNASLRERKILTTAEIKSLAGRVATA